MTARKRLTGLDGVRGIAALGVVVLHISFYSHRPFAAWEEVDGVFGGLRLGVTAFFVLSAFLLAGPWLAAARGEAPRPHAGRFLIARAARILPAYYAALAFAALLLAGTTSWRSATGQDVPLLLLLVQNWSADARGLLVPPSWTLCVEASFYLALPLFGLALLRFATTRTRQLAFCLGLAALSVAFNALLELQDLPRHWHGTFPGVGYEFAAGIAAAALTAGRAPSRNKRGWLLAGGLALVLFDAVAHKPLGLPGIWLWHDLPAAVGFAAIVAAVATGPALITGSAPLRWLGERSYALYLLHYPVILALATRGRLPQDFLPAAILVTGVTLVLSDLSWRFLERPFQRLARRRSSWRPVPLRALPETD